MRRLANWALPLALLAFLDASVVHPNDYWWHVKTGEIIAKTGRVPDVELWAYTREGVRWVNEPWLMQLAMYGAFAAGGVALGVLLHALFVAGGYTLVWFGAQKREGVGAASLATLVGVCVGAANWGVRPQGASFLFFGAMIALIERDRAGKSRALYLAPPLLALWANCHGGFTFGLLALGAYLAVRVFERVRAKEPFRPLVVVGVAAVLACLLTPIGPRGIIEHVAAFFASSAAGVKNEELAPLTVHAPDGLIFIYAVGRLVVACRRAKSWPRTDETVQLAALAIVALATRRSAPWFGLALIPVLARALARENAAGEAKPARSAPAALGVVALVACLVTIPFFRPRVPLLYDAAPIIGSDTPVTAGKWICANVPEGERVFSDQVTASFLEWSCPRVGVFVDTRVQAFPAQIWNEYLAIEGARWDWEQILAKWKIRWLMLSPEETILIRAAKASGKWREQYRDPRSVVFVHDPE